MAQETMDTTAAESSYPVQYSVEYPESSNRLKALFRLILIIPIAVIYILVSGINGALFPALVFMLLFRKKYPRWWFAVNLEVERFTARSGPTSPSCATSTPLPTNSKPSNWTSNTPMPKTI